MQLSQIIEIGRYRECYAIADTDLCCKKLKPLQIKVRSIITHYFRDINQEEVEVYNTIPNELKSFFPKVTYRNGKMLVSQRPKTMITTILNRYLNMEKYPIKIFGVM